MTIRRARRIAAPWFWVVMVMALLTGSTASGGSWHDDFEDGGSDDWVVFNFNPDSESWDEKGGFIVGEINRPGFFSVLQLKPRRPGDVNSDEWSNYTVKVKMRLESKPQDDQDTGFGLILYDHLDQLQYHLIRLQYQQSNILARIDTGEAIGRETAPFNVERGVWYDLTATIETLEDSERVTYQINGNPPVTVNWNGQIHSGGVGLTVRDGRVSFDDFVVEGDSIPNGGNGRPRSVSPSGLSTMTWAELKK